MTATMNNSYSLQLMPRDKMIRNSLLNNTNVNIYALATVGLIIGIIVKDILQGKNIPTFPKMWVSTERIIL